MLIVKNLSWLVKLQVLYSFVLMVERFKPVRFTAIPPLTVPPHLFMIGQTIQFHVVSFCSGKWSPCLMVNISIAHSFLHFVPRDPREIHVSGQKDMLHPPYWLVSSPNLSKPFADQTLVVQGHGHPGKIWRRVREVSDRSMLGSGARLNKGIV